MKNFYVGPLWGNVCSELLILPELKGGRIHFFGAYGFFGTEGLEVVDWLNLHKNKAELRFNKSRFEEYFLVLSNLASEKNYNFRRWINPLSGIVSCVSSYGIMPSEVFEDPENLHKKLIVNIEEAGHLSFYKGLEENLFPPIVEDLIEQSIRNREAFKLLKIYDEKGQVAHTIEFKTDFLNIHLTKILESIEHFSESSLTGEV